MIPLALFQSSAGVINITISSNQTNLNLKTLFESSYPPAQSGDTVNFTINPGVIIDSMGSLSPSLRTGVWAAGVILTLDNNSIDVVGAGGAGNGPNPGKDGGTAFLAESPITVDNAGGRFAGGGGGGAGTDQRFGTGAASSNTYQAGGGGGAGRTAGLGYVVTGSTNNASGANGTPTGGGAGGNFGPDPNQPSVTPGPFSGGNGGGLGLPGGDAGDVGEPGSTDNVGGAAGYSVDGVSNVTWVDMGTLTGPTN